MKEINYKEMKFNPFNLIGGEWMLVTAGNEQSGCNTMTASWGHLGCLWGHNDPTAVIYLRPSRYTKKFVDEEPYFTLCVMDKSFKKQMAYLGSWRISEATLLLLAVIGGSIGALLGMQVWHHKTMHKKFKYGLPLILLAQIAIIYFINK